MNDEEFRASNLRKEQFKQLANNPTDNMTVYRMQSGPGDSLGLHWSTDQNVAHYTGLGGGGDDRTVHRATVDRSQVITQGEWKSGNIRSHYTDEGQFKTGKSQWGFDSEAEVRLRPGTTVRDHATAAAGTHEYEPSGRQPTIESRGRDYVDLAHHAVQGTPEANRLHSIQGALPHKQQAMFDPVVDFTTDKTVGYTPKYSLLRGDMGRSSAIDWATKDVERVGKAAGVDEWSVGAENAHEPMLSELRSQPAPEPQVHKRVASQTQFAGLEGF